MKLGLKKIKRRLKNAVILRASIDNMESARGAIL